VFPLLLAVLKKGRQYTELVYASWSSKLVFVRQSSSVSRRSETSVQCSSDSRIQEATSAKVFTIIVICVVAVNLQSE
jgi:hypothetical protein